MSILHPTLSVERLMIKILVFFCFLASLAADEGMWPLNMIPERYALDPGFIDHIQKASLRLSAGGSGSFVSAHGLVLTNHHVARSAIHDLSSEQRDLIKNGFIAHSLDEELPIPKFFIDQLISIKDVTDRIAPFADEHERQREIAAICEEAAALFNLQPQVVTLYKGALYHLYLYKRYTDVRLVMAPERSIAFFGGDEENFEYPRHNLDAAFLRIYEDGKPLQNSFYFPFSTLGPQEDELLFVIGNPGKTDRMLTNAHLDFLKNIRYPLALQQLEARIRSLEEFSKKSDEHARIAQDELAALLNAQKVYKATYAKLAEGIGRDRYSECLDLMEALTDLETYYKEYYLLEFLNFFGCKYALEAKHLVRMAEELKKPNEERLPEYQESNLAVIELELKSSEPTYPEFELEKFHSSVQFLKTALGIDHPAVQIVLDLDKEHVDFNALQLALDPYTRALRGRFEGEFKGAEQACYAAIADRSLSPDATFTLRFSAGKMVGYDDFLPYTTFSSLFAKEQEEEPYRLPASWQDAKAALAMSTPMNFVSTHDIIGGNSGSPVINRNGELVGLIFDGNRYSFISHFCHDEKQARAISVHSKAILEALDKVYHASNLLSELNRG